MNRCACWMVRLANVMARRSVAVLVLIILNPLHMLFHGSPLDSGTLDGLIQTINAWAINEAHR